MSDQNQSSSTAIPAATDSKSAPSARDSRTSYTPSSTVSRNTPEPTPPKSADDDGSSSKDENPAIDTPKTPTSEKMEAVHEVKAAGENADLNKNTEDPSSTNAKETAASSSSKKDKSAKSKCKQTSSKKKHKKVDKGKKKKKKVVESESDSDSELSSESESDSDSSASIDSDSDSTSEEDTKKRKSRAKRRAADKKTAKKSKKSKKAKKYDSSSESSSDSSDSSSDSDSEEEARRKRKKKKKAKKSRIEESESEAEQEEPAEEEEDGDIDTLDTANAIAQHLKLGRSLRAGSSGGQDNNTRAILEALQKVNQGSSKKSKPDKTSKNKKAKKVKDDKKKKPKKGSKPEFKRVDHIWDTTIHDYRLTETAEEQPAEFDEYVFNVRRRFDWENKYKNTVVDIKSKHLRDVLAEVMKDVKAVSLVEHRPTLDPNMLFLYLEELRTFYRRTLRDRLKRERKRKVQKRIKTMIAQAKLLVKYLDEDYEETKKKLFPMLKAGNITFDLLWALFKPNTLAYTATYGSSEQPRCFKVDYANKEKTFMRGEYYCVEGRYLEYDGKNYGLGDFEVHIDSFKGPRKITSLPTYPLEYHKNPEGLRQQLIDRGKKFVSLSGMNYKFMKGLAFHKKKRNLIVKVNVNGRIMIDPAIFRRINPNYVISSVKPKEDSYYSEDDEESSCSCGDDDSDQGDDGLSDGDGLSKTPQTRFKVVLDENNEPKVVQVRAKDSEEEAPKERLDKLPNGSGEEAEGSSTEQREFTEEELLISSPVVLGFSFTEKAWLEFSLSGVSDIKWNEKAFESLVLPPSHKSIVKAQVCSHKFHAAETIDDVIQGKGKGLVFVLHGPPGVGKTLTAEGIAEFLKCPLYAVSAGELGTDARIEMELQKIMDIAHSWGAVLLLDEADVFLEKRQHQDVHRNALVSIFLRLLEYFQGILFLTTNRVETFDDAFQSRIHIALRYEELTPKAKREIWTIFIDRVREGSGAVSEFKDADFDRLSRESLNGRQIKNAVKTAQALAVYEKAPLSMEHIRRVLEVAESFERDLKGGSGYLDAMRSYT